MPLSVSRSLCDGEIRKKKMQFALKTQQCAAFENLYLVGFISSRSFHAMLLWLDDSACFLMQEVCVCRCSGPRQGQIKDIKPAQPSLFDNTDRWRKKKIGHVVFVSQSVLTDAVCASVFLRAKGKAPGSPMNEWMYFSLYSSKLSHI